MPYDYSQQKEPMRTREYAYVKEVENMLNGSFDFGRFAACLPEMHRTLQQRFFRLVKECICLWPGPETSLSTTATGPPTKCAAI